MSTEEMVVAIQGGNTALLEPLWGKLQRLVRKFAYRYYTATQGRGGVTVEDLEQAGFLAMMDAIPRYNPEEAVFSTYLAQYLRKHFQEASGRLYMDTKGYFMPKDALNTCISLNAPVDDEEETELMEITADPAANMESVEEKIWHEQLRDALDNALSAIPGDLAEILRLRNYERLTLDEIGERWQLGRERIRQLEDKAIRKLREPKLACRLRPFYDFNIYAGTGLSAFRQSGMSIQERYIAIEEERQERMRKQRHAEREAEKLRMQQALMEADRLIARLRSEEKP